METFNDKIIGAGQLTTSEQAKMDLQSTTFKTVAEFLITYINLITSSEGLASEVEAELSKRVTSEDETISTSALIAIYKIAKDVESVGAKGILDILKVNTQVHIENNTPAAGGGNQSDLTSLEVDKYKKIADVLEKLLITEGVKDKDE